LTAPTSPASHISHPTIITIDPDYPKNGSWNALNPSTAAKAAALRANGLLTNWVSLEKTVRADPESVEGSKHGRFFMTSTAGFRIIQSCLTDANKTIK